MENTLITAELADSVVIEKSKREAIEFAEWIAENIYAGTKNSQHIVNWFEYPIEKQITSCAELYELFKKQQ